MHRMRARSVGVLKARLSLPGLGLLFVSLAVAGLACVGTNVVIAATVPMPDWSDEAAAYEARGIESRAAHSHIADGRYSKKRLGRFTGVNDIADTHTQTEGDDLWTAYRMYRRLQGAHPEAARAWYQRARSLAEFFKTSYVGGNAWKKDAAYNHDHLYGWGLCDWASGESDSAAIEVIDRIATAMIAWNAQDFVVNPGDPAFRLGGGGRRWARQLRFAVCAAEVSATPANRIWRDKVIDIMLQSPDWDADNKMYWLGAGPTDNSSRLGKGAFARGDRIAITFHMGIWMDALWHAWLALDAEGDARAADVRQRLIDMATFYRDIPLDDNGLLRLNLGYNVKTKAPIIAGGTGAPRGVYTIPPVNGLVVAYKFTGDRSYLERAWTLYMNWQAARSGTTGQLDHFVDSQIASATGFRFLSNNKGELQYVYALFENGGEPLTIATETIE
jgi:hypothetical protein